MGVVLWYQIEFPDQRITVSSDVTSGDYLVDAEITITYEIGQPAAFDVRFRDLPLPISEALADALTKAMAQARTKNTGIGPDAGGVGIHIRLGYLDDPGFRPAVLVGRIESLEGTTTFPPLGTRLRGHDEASFLLLNTVNVYHEPAPPDLAYVSEPKQDSGEPVSFADVAKIIVKGSGATLAAAPAPLSGPDPLATPLVNQTTGKALPVTAEAEDAFRLLRRVADRSAAEILVQEGTVMFGRAVQYPPPATPGLPIANPAAVLALITGDLSLIAVTGTGVIGTRLAEFKPVQVASTSRTRAGSAAAPTDARGFDFTALGAPALRAGQLVVASVDGYQDPRNPFRILTVTHTFSPRSGYTCAGRALAFQQGGGNGAVTEVARPGSAPAVADRIAGKIRESMAAFPAVDVGRVKAVKPADRVATVCYRQPGDGPTVASPSVDLDVPESKSVLLSKPIAAPFAWHDVGLSVPVYPGMRAVLEQVRGSRDDTVVTGFLWANEPKMTPPPAKDGDWWLCLPTKVSGTPPKPAGEAANDLTAADGRRVIEVAGLSVAVGRDVCSDVGSRPSEGPADVFRITHKSGTTVEIDDSGNVTVTGKGDKVVLDCGGVTLTVGSGKVAIS